MFTSRRYSQRAPLACALVCAFAPLACSQRDTDAQELEVDTAAEPQGEPEPASAPANTDDPDPRKWFAPHETWTCIDGTWVTYGGMRLASSRSGPPLRDDLNDKGG